MLLVTPDGKAFLEWRQIRGVIEHLSFPDLQIVERFRFTCCQWKIMRGEEGMRDEARSEDGFAGAQVDALVADLEDDFALHEVKPLLLRDMHVQCRA
jgi:hypothetical protein